jgi:hypothetical protein
MSADQPSQPDTRRQTAGPSTERLAELVSHLTDCPLEQAVAAVEAVKTAEPADADAALEVVARAMQATRHIDLRQTIDLRENTDELPDRLIADQQ